MDVVNGNKIIAQFMGYTYFPFNMEGVREPGWKTTIDTSSIRKFNDSSNLLSGDVFFVNEDGTKKLISKNKNKPKKHYLCRNHHQLSYHSDWNSLIEVGKKINETKLLLPMNGVIDSIVPWINARRPIVSGLIDMDIMKTWEGVVEFIKWYNENKN